MNLAFSSILNHCSSASGILKFQLIGRSFKQPWGGARHLKSFGQRLESQFQIIDIYMIEFACLGAGNWQAVIN